MIDDDTPMCSICCSPNHAAYRCPLRIKGLKAWRTVMSEML